MTTSTNHLDTAPPAVFVQRDENEIVLYEQMNEDAWLKGEPVQIRR